MFVTPRLISVFLFLEQNGRTSEIAFETRKAQLLDCSLNFKDNDDTKKNQFFQTNS